MPEGHALFVVVSGPPGSGKSTLAPALASQLYLPLIAKDNINDALVTVLDVCDVEASRRVGTAAVAAMLAIAHNCPAGAVLESNFYRFRAAGQLRSLPGRVVEVFCSCDRSVAERRYQERRSTERSGYFDAERSPDELWNDEIAQPVGGGSPVIEVDTNAPVNVARTTAQIRDLAASYPTGLPKSHR